MRRKSLTSLGSTTAPPPRAPSYRAVAFALAATAGGIDGAFENALREASGLIGALTADGLRADEIGVILTPEGARADRRDRLAAALRADGLTSLARFLESPAVPAGYAACIFVGDEPVLTYVPCSEFEARAVRIADPTAKPLRRRLLIRTRKRRR